MDFFIYMNCLVVLVFVINFSFRFVGQLFNAFRNSSVMDNSILYPTNSFRRSK